MTFLSNIPQANHNLDFSQGQLLSNNAALDTIFSADHTIFSGSGPNRGFHNKVTLYQVATDPSQTFPGSLIYSKNAGSMPNRVTNLFFSSKPETGVDKVAQITNQALVTTSGEGFMPGGVQIRSGVANGLTANNSNQAVSYSSVFPIATLFVVACLSNSDQARGIQTATTGLSPGGFNAKCNGSGTFNINYIAVGY